jgi:hypothetical protein
VTTRRISKREWELWDEWRPNARVIADTLNRFYGYEVEHDDGAVVEAICHDLGIEPDWTPGYSLMVRRFAGTCMPESKPKRPPWRTATPDDAWSPTA